MLKLDDMINGWFVGDFEPAALQTNSFEVAVKRYRAGDRDRRHFHKLGHEITVVVSGRVVMLDREWDEGSIIDIQPGVPSSFEAITDAVLTVVKVPSIPNDKFLLDD